MTRQSELLKKIDTLPPKYIGEVIDFVGYLQQKARLEANDNNVNRTITENIKNNKGKLDFTKRELDELLENADTPHSDALLGLLSDVGDISIEQIREERLAGKYPEYFK